MHVVEMFEGRLHGGALFAGSEVDHVTQPVRGVLHQELGGFEAFGVLAFRRLHPGGDTDEAGEGGACCLLIACADLLAFELGEVMEQLGVEEALLAELGFVGALLEVLQGGRRRNRFIGF